MNPDWRTIDALNIRSDSDFPVMCVSPALPVRTPCGNRRRALHSTDVEAGWGWKDLNLPVVRGFGGARLVIDTNARSASGMVLCTQNECCPDFSWKFIYAETVSLCVHNIPTAAIFISPNENRGITDMFSINTTCS